ncbi:MAG TPA: PD-(D/E)XK nuclease family protein [Candidatus Paceibacterota bacterium]|nr:PD-(D/E)XK nuclease family protein [Candidatus Paceibacterota bacterium]
MSKIRLSPSRVSDFSNCPQLYKFRAIDQLPEPISLDAERGTLVHTVLEKLFDSPALMRTLETALEILPGSWLEQVAAKPALQESVVDLKEWFDRASSLLTTYFTLESPAAFEPTSRELHLEMDLSEEIYLHGYIDRLDIAVTGEVRIVDYKTGKAPKPGWEEKVLFQLRIYALIYWRNHGVLPRLLQLIYLGDGQLIRSTPTLSQLENTEKKLFAIAGEIIAAIQSEVWRPKPSRLCDWCSFKSICPAFTGDRSVL